MPQAPNQPVALLSTECKAHYLYLVQAIMRRGYAMEMNSTTPVKYLTGFPSNIKHRFIPGPVTLFQRATRVSTPHWLDNLDGAFFDTLSAKFLGHPDVVFGAASSSRDTGKAAHKLGAKFVLDRACPDIRVQVQQIAEETKKLGGAVRHSAPWFIERQVEEYEEADLIISPSNYSRSSYPKHLQDKMILVPLFGRAPVAKQATAARDESTFTVGVVGGNPVRKGYIYLLEAWKKLALPNAKLLIRSSGDLERFPAISKLIAEMPNVEIVGYVPNLSDFYARCHAFVLPSIDDGFGMALFEAMAHGVPCVATRNCGASELLSDGEEILIADAYSYQQLADGIEKLYLSSELREKIGAAGAKAVAAMEKDGVPLPYERGMDSLFAALKQA